MVHHPSDPTPESTLKHDADTDTDLMLEQSKNSDENVIIRIVNDNETEARYVRKVQSQGNLGFPQFISDDTEYFSHRPCSECLCSEATCAVCGMAKPEIPAVTRINPGDHVDFEWSGTLLERNAESTCVRYLSGPARRTDVQILWSSAVDTFTLSEEDYLSRFHPVGSQGALLAKPILTAQTPITYPLNKPIIILKLPK